MAGRKSLPRHCLVVREYREFREIVRAFARGAYHLLCILGGPGLGKSEAVKRAMQETLGAGSWCLIKGKHTPLDLYEQLFRFRLSPLVFDDLDDLLRKPENVMLLKCVCETHLVKRVAWGSRHAAFRGGGDALPTSFDSISSACLIGNDWNVIDRNVAALHDRGVVTLFQPTALEVHTEVARAGWFDDAAIFDFIGQHLFLVVEPSFRLYLTARQHKNAGLDWRDLTLRSIESEADPNLILVARLLADPQFEKLSAPESARIQAFHAQGGGSRATYHRRKSELEERRGEINPDRVAGIKLQPTKRDLSEVQQLEQWELLEELRGEFSNVRQEDRGSDSAGACLDTLLRLRRQMSRAIAREDYKRAAELRDEIRRIESNSKGPIV